MQVTDWLGKPEFEKIISEPGPHLVVFAAKWCGFCSKFVGQAKSLETQAKIELSLVDADEPDESLWDEFAIKIVPTLAVFTHRQVVFRRDGRSGAGLNMSDLQEGISKAATDASQADYKK